MNKLDKIMAAADQTPYAKVVELVELMKALRERGLYITAIAAYAYGVMDGKQAERARRRTAPAQTEKDQMIDQIVDILRHDHRAVKLTHTFVSSLPGIHQERQVSHG